MDKTSIEWKPETQQIILNCSDKLWNYLQDIKTKGLDNLDIIQVAKMYKELKSLDVKIEKGEIEDGKS